MRMFGKARRLDIGFPQAAGFTLTLLVILALLSAAVSLFSTPIEAQEQTTPDPISLTVSAERGDDPTTASVSWSEYEGADFDYYRVIVCDDTQYDGASCSGTVFRSEAYFDVNHTGPENVTGLDAATRYGVILQVWRKGDAGALKIHAMIPALEPESPPTPSPTPLPPLRRQFAARHHYSACQHDYAS